MNQTQQDLDDLRRAYARAAARLIGARRVLKSMREVMERQREISQDMLDQIDNVLSPKGEGLDS